VGENLEFTSKDYLSLFDTANMTDEMMITIMGGLAQEESTSISQNMRWSIKKRMENGTFNPAYLPYGYDRVHGKIVINEAESEIVKYVFSQYISGNGMESIAKQLNAAKINKDEKGYIWCKNTIRYILMNEKYTGKSIFRKYYTTDNFPYKQKENKGEFRTISCSEYNAGYNIRRNVCNSAETNCRTKRKLQIFRKNISSDQ